MCLILTTVAAVVSTVIWYASATMRGMKIGVLCWLFWGAAVMWSVDLAFEYREEGADVFNPSYRIAVAVKPLEEAGEPEESAEAAMPESAAPQAENAAEPGNADADAAVSMAEADGNDGAADAEEPCDLTVEPSDDGAVTLVFNTRSLAGLAVGSKVESSAPASVPAEPFRFVVKPSDKGIAVELAHVDGILNDTVLGLAVITLALVIWVIVLLVSDPQGILRAALLKKKS